MKRSSTATPLLPTAETQAAARVLEDLVEELALEVVFQVHRQDKLARSLCQICRSMCRSFVHKPDHDIFGNRTDAGSHAELYECLNCHRKFPAQRYAQHLEKCLGIGRTSTRAGGTAPRRAAASQLTSYAGMDESGEDEGTPPPPSSSLSATHHSQPAAAPPPLSSSASHYPRKRTSSMTQHGSTTNNTNINNNNKMKKRVHGTLEVSSPSPAPAASVKPNHGNILGSSGRGTTPDLHLGSRHG